MQESNHKRRNRVFKSSLPKLNRVSVSRAMSWIQVFVTGPSTVAAIYFPSGEMKGISTLPEMRNHWQTAMWPRGFRLRDPTAKRRSFFPRQGICPAETSRANFIACQ